MNSNKTALKMNLEEKISLVDLLAVLLLS